MPPSYQSSNYPPNSGALHPLQVAPVIAAGRHLDFVISQILTEGKVGKVFMMHLGLADYVVVQDADAVREVLVTANYPKSPTYKVKDGVCMHGL